MNRKLLFRSGLVVAVALIVLTCVFFISGCSNGKLTSDQAAAGKVNTEELHSYFQNFDGCFLLYDMKTGKYSVYNEVRSEKQFSPCSTFKIYNSLIGLETKVLQDENTVLKWDGTHYPIESWNRDHTLKSAIANSVVWYYKQSASKVGPERMKQYIDLLNYGNKDISSGITNFWLHPNSLKISPKEQMDLLRKLYNYQLPFSRRNIDSVKKIIVQFNDGGTVLSGKTGSGMKDNQYVLGWFVGYVEKEGNVYFFVNNIEGQDNAGGDKAKSITLSILKDKGLIN